MSRIGRLPIKVPSGVQVNISGRHISVKGPKGTLDWDFPASVQVAMEDGTIEIQRADDTIANKALHGLSRALIHNMVKGVSEGFSKVLEIQGTGYRANVQGQILMIEVGYSNPVRFDVPEGITITVERNVLVTVAGVDKELVGRTAAHIRKIRPPEPYKGKGIRYRDEYVRRKVGKKNV